MTMYRIAELLVDSEGRYYVNAPSPGQGGTGGYGTYSVPSGDLHETLVLLESLIQHLPRKRNDQ